MMELLCSALVIVAALFKSRRRLEAENVMLRHQLMILRRRLPGRVRLTNSDRWLLVQLYRWFPSTLQALTVIGPETARRSDRAEKLDWTTRRFPAFSWIQGLSGSADTERLSHN
jgi:hypothetical protein